MDIDVPLRELSAFDTTSLGEPVLDQEDVGQAYKTDNQKPHSVMNKGTEDRITCIYDYVPPSPLGQSSKGQNSNP